MVLVVALGFGDMSGRTVEEIPGEGLSEEESQCIEDCKIRDCGIKDTICRELVEDECKLECEINK